MKSLFVKPYAKYIARQVRRERDNAIADQSKMHYYLLKVGKQTLFGQDHSFESIRSHKDWCEAVPIRDYEGLRSYVDKVVDGESDILWKGKPKYFAKTSGTTSGIKYIPITHDSMPNHINAARKTMMSYSAIGDNVKVFDGKAMFLSGSPTLYQKNGVATGRLSGIVNHELPAIIKGNQLPSYDINCIEDWEEKVEAIVQQTKTHDLRLISGIPPWVQMYFERILDVTGKSVIKEVFPKLQVFFYGGVNYEPYRDALEGLIGESIDSLETYPASEGFIAFQDTLDQQGLLLNTNAGIFYEFVPLNEWGTEKPTRYTLKDVEIDKDYVIILSSNAGLWAYNLGDTVRFASKDPYRIVVSGRVKHFISAFGEHVIGKEVEQAMLQTCAQHKASVIEYTVAPQVNPTKGLPYHEWFIEWESTPDNLDAFRSELDEALCKQNAYYEDLIKGAILKPLVINSVKAGTFRNYMKSKGKLGGQNKVPRLSNDRKIADALNALV